MQTDVMAELPSADSLAKHGPGSSSFIRIDDQRPQPSTPDPVPDRFRHRKIILLSHTLIGGGPHKWEIYSVIFERDPAVERKIGRPLKPGRDGVQLLPDSPLAQARHGRQSALLEQRRK